MKKITQFADKLVDLIRKVEIKTDNNIEARFFSAMIDLLLLVKQKEREKLKEYEDLEKRGFISKLPAKVGDTVYSYCSEFGVLQYEVNAIIIDEKIMFICSAYSKCIRDYQGECLDEIEPYISDFGKTVFLTREEAEAAFRKNEA